MTLTPHRPLNHYNHTGNTIDTGQGVSWISCTFKRLCRPARARMTAQATAPKATSHPTWPYPVGELLALGAPGYLEEAERCGYTDVWTSESNGPDAFTPRRSPHPGCRRCGWGPVWSPHLHGGLQYSRETAIAMASAAPGRFVLGVGSSSDIMVRDWNGLSFDRPYSHTRDVIRFLTRAFLGRGRHREFRHVLREGIPLLPAEPPPTLVVAAARERMLRLGGVKADGVVINLCSASDVRKIAAVVHDENPEAEIVDRIMVCPTDDADAVYKAVKPIVASYTSVGVYRARPRMVGSRRPPGGRLGGVGTW